ncbi:hypothetical protein QBE52_15475 [Clostridiaceae bacterium 35-E11]
MEDRNLEEQNIDEQDTKVLDRENQDVEVLNLEDLKNVKDTPSKMNHPVVANMLSNLLSSEMLLPLFLFTLWNKGGRAKANTDDIHRTAQIVKGVRPYMGEQINETLGKAESLLDVLYALNRYANHEYKQNESYAQSYRSVPDKHIKILEAVRPHVRGKSKEKIEKVLTVNDRISRIKQNTGEKRNMLQDIENVTDILEILQVEKGHEIKKMLNKVKTIMAIMRE